MKKFLLFLLIKKFLSRIYKFFNDFKPILIAKLSKRYPQFILRFTPKFVKRKLEENLLMQYKKNFYLRLVEAAKAELYNKKNDNEKSIRVINLWSGDDGINWIKHDFKVNPISLIIEKRKEIFNLIENYLNANENIKTICEIGTGDGRYLNFLSKKLEQIDKFIGIDLNKDIMDENNQIYKHNHKLRFIHGTVNKNYREIKNLSSNSILFVSFRTLTWFTQSELEDLFRFISEKEENLSIAFFEQNEIYGNKNKKIKSKARECIC